MFQRLSVQVRVLAKTLATSLVSAATLAAPGMPSPGPDLAGVWDLGVTSLSIHACFLCSAALPLQKSDLMVGDDYSLPEEFFNL